MERQAKYTDVIECLESLLVDAIEKLRQTNGREKLSLKLQLEKAIRLLELAESHNLDPDMKVVSLPFVDWDSEYRIMLDYGAEQRENWSELTVNGEVVRLYPGDAVVRR